MARTKGALNKRTRAALHAVESGELGRGGESPINYLLRVMRDSRRPDAVRIEAAKAVAPYLQPRLSSVDLANRAPPMESEEALLGKLAELIQANPDLAQILAQHIPSADHGGLPH